MPRSNTNKSEISGLVTGGPNLDKTPSGTHVLRLEVRSRRFSRRDEKQVEYYDLLDVVVYGPAAKRLAEQITRGSVVEVIGRLESRMRPVTVDGEVVHDSSDKKVTYRAVRVVATTLAVFSSHAETSEDSASEARAS